jgi:hypothetical protein
LGGFSFSTKSYDKSKIKKSREMGFGEQMTERLTVRQHLDLDNFNPLDIEIEEFRELANAMPLDANLDGPNAEKLASRFLRAADRCSEILSTLILREGRAKSSLNTVKNRLYLEASDEGYRTIKEREAYSESHEDFISAAEAYNEAHAVRKFFESKQKWFIDAHYLMRQRLKGEYKHQTASGFSETSGNEKPYGEKSWR